MASTVKIKASLITPSGEPFHGHVTVELIPGSGIVDTDIITTVSGLRKTIVDGKVEFDLVPSSLIGEDSYYAAELHALDVDKVFGPKERLAWRKLFLVPGHNADLSDLIIMQPIKPIPVAPAEQLVMKAQTAAGNASSSAASASSSASAAGTAKTAAEGAQASAESARDAASASAGTATTKASEASVSAAAASASASAAGTAKTAAEGAQASAESARDAASASAGTATTKASEASASAAAASASASAAGVAKSAAESAQASAEAFRDAASASAGTATTKASEASASAAAASASASAALSSMNAADASAISASGSRSAAEAAVESASAYALSASDDADRAETAAEEAAASEASIASAIATHNEAADSHQDIRASVSSGIATISARLENIENLPPDLVTSINAYYAMRRTGKVYQTKLWKFSTNTSPAGVKLLDNADLVCQPSTDTVEGRDDYADIPLFQWVNVNYIREADGTPVPVAIEGQPGYKTEGAVDVGAMQMSFWWNWEDFEEYSLVTISDMPHPELGLKPWPECVRADGSMTEYCIGSKYMAGLASDGLYRSQPNIPLWNKTCSHNALVIQMQKKGAGYWGAGIAHWSFAPVMLAIKYGTKNSQSVMQGCYGYSVTSYASQAENGVKRVIVPNANYVVGSYIQIGSATTDVGRSNVAGYDVIDHARIASIESAGTGLYALNLDIDKTISVPSGAVVYSTPYNGGDTDAVIGRHDGSRLSNTDSKHPFRIQGREYAVGAYNISADVAMFNTANCDKEVFWAKRGVAHSTADATIRATYKKVGELFGNAGADYWVGDITMDTESGALLQVAPIGSSNATGWCDRFYAGGTATTGSREFLQGGDLGCGSGGGSCCLHCGYWLGNAGWNVAARD